MNRQSRNGALPENGRQVLDLARRTGRAEEDIIESRRRLGLRRTQYQPLEDVFGECLVYREVDDIPILGGAERQEGRSGTQPALAAQGPVRKEDAPVGADGDDVVRGVTR